MSRLGVIFDMDGVLVDSYRAHFQSWHRIIGQHGVQLSENDFARTFGRTSREIIRQLWPGRFSDAEIRQIDRSKEQAYRDILQEHFPEMPGASDLIRRLHGDGFALAIGSSAPPENVELGKRLLAAGDLIDVTVNGSEVKHGKPEPDVFLQAARKMGIAPHSCAVVEDAPVGVEAALRGGMSAIALVGTATREALASHAHLVVNSLEELSPEAIRNLIDRARG